MPGPLSTLRFVLAATVTLGAGGCPSGSSLDRATESVVEDTGTSGGTEEASSSGGSRPAPVVCSSACSPVLRATWTYEGDPGDREASAMTRLDDGSWVVAVERATGGARIVRLDAEGEGTWSIVPQLPCLVCEPVDVQALPSGDLVLSMTGELDLSYSAAVVARLYADGRGVAWSRQFVLGGGSQAVSRAGDIAVQGDDRIGVLQLEGFSDSELVTVRELDGQGSTRNRRNIEVQAGTIRDYPLLMAAGPLGDVVVVHPWWNDEDDPENPRLEALTTRHLPPDYEQISEQQLPLVLDEMTIDAQGRRIEVARSAGEQTTTLLISSRSAADLEGWSLSLPLVTTSSTRPALSIGPRDEVYVAARTTPRGADDEYFVVELAVARISPGGEIEWQASSPLDMQATDDPLEIGIDDDDGIVVATVVQGRLRVVRYEQACACE